jgi:hypothetical protein
MRALVALGVVAVCAGCATVRPPVGSVPAREWSQNARGVIELLRNDVIEVSGGDRVPGARRVLHDDSQLYVALVAYTDFGGCRHMVGSLGVPPRRWHAVALQLAHACDALQRASTLFSEAMAASDVRVLAAAASSAERAAPPLDRAALALTA